MRCSAVRHRHLPDLRLVGLRNRNMRISCLRRAPKLATVQAVATRDQVTSQKSKLQHLYHQAQKTFGGRKQPSSPEALQAVTEALCESCEPQGHFVQCWETEQSDNICVLDAS